MYDAVNQSYNSSLVITNERYTELVRKETKLEMIEKLLTAKTSYNNYIDATDVKIILGIEEAAQSEQ